MVPGGYREFTTYVIDRPLYFVLPWGLLLSGDTYLLVQVQGGLEKTQLLIIGLLIRFKFAAH